MRIYIYEHNLRWYWKLFAKNKYTRTGEDVIARCATSGYATRSQCEYILSLTKATLNKMKEF